MTLFEKIILFILFTTLLILLLIGFISMMIYRNKKKYLEYQININRIKLNHENQLLKSQLEIQEQTFQNISREIHDNIGQKLSLATLHLNTFTLIDNDSNVTQYREAIKIIGEAMADLRDISRSLSSEIISNNGLMKAIEHEISQLNKTSLYDIKLKITGEQVFLDHQKELVLFRIVQESINNIMKHAEATEVLVDALYSSSHLELSIRDNGKGFDENTSSAGNGLSNIRKRAIMLNGNCTVESTIGKGTTIHIKIPLHEA